jgi:hypothetical protein
MMKAMAPITGGINCPPVPAAASIPAATLGGIPVETIIGIVMLPIVAASEEGEPVIISNSPLATIVDLATPPHGQRATLTAKLMNHWPAPASCISRPKIMWDNYKFSNPNGFNLSYTALRSGSEVGGFVASIMTFDANSCRIVT